MIYHFSQSKRTRYQFSRAAISSSVTNLTFAANFLLVYNAAEYTPSRPFEAMSFPSSGAVQLDQA